MASPNVQISKKDVRKGMIVSTKGAEKSFTKSKKQTEEKESVSDQLKVVLADTFVLYMKTYAVHWNYQGGKFFSVHQMTENHYQDLAKAIDDIAERIRALGDPAPVSLQAMLGSSDVNEFTAESIVSDRALDNLAASHLELARKAKETAHNADDAEDDFSADLMIARIGAHEKAAWMIKSLLR